MSGDRTRRVLVSTFGSAGDLFPLVPSILQLIGEGHEVRCAVPRSLGLYLRMLGVPTLALGDGSEVRVLEDSQMFTTRFDGWSSWRRTLNRYVAPSLKHDVSTIEVFMRSWPPDVVLASGFAMAARLAASRASIPVINASIYPQHGAIDNSAGGFATELRSMVRALAEDWGSQPDTATLWGTPPDALLHDRLLLEGDTISSVIGYPYWDNIVAQDTDFRLIEGRLAEPGPHVAVSLGSFVGLASRHIWLRIAEAIRTLGVRAIFVGVRSRWSDEVFASQPGILCTGFVPLSPVFADADLAIHHGGLGTTFSALRGGCPAVVLPQAFDQSYNCRMIERCGVGLDGDVNLEMALTSILNGMSYRECAATFAGSLTPTESSARTLTRLTLCRATGSSVL